MAGKENASDALSLETLSLLEAAATAGDKQDTALQDAVRRSLLAGDVRAFREALTLQQPAATETATTTWTVEMQLVFLMDWFHRWQQEYEAFAEVLEAELAGADDVGSVDSEDAAEDDEEEEEDDETEQEETQGVDVREIQFVEKDLEELEAEAQEVFKGFSTVARALLESLAGSADTLLDKHGWTLLMQAANSGLRELVDALVARDVDVNCGGTASGGVTPLYLALSSDHTNEAMALLKNGAIASATKVVTTTAMPTQEDHKTEDGGEEEEPTPAEVEEDCAWFQACRMGQLAVVEEMLALGVDINFALPTSGDRALHVAAMFEMQDVVELLVANDKLRANATNASGQTCLFGASNVELVQFLVERGGVDARVTDADGETALSVASALGDDDVAAFLAPRMG